jgi:glycosyltransferase involved in cell wall biosynthesis
MKTPLLSVVIPTRNRAQLVRDAIRCALAQREDEVEVILVDDASTDSTAELLEREFGDRIRLLRLEHRRGPGGARNAGARLARGEFVSFLDSDDIWLPGKLDAELELFARFEAEVVVCDSQTFFEGALDGESRFTHNGLLERTGREPMLAGDCQWLWTNSLNTAHTSSITARRTALARLGEKLFAEDLVCCEDWEFQMRLYHPSRVVVLPQVFTHIRRFVDESRMGRNVPGRPTTPEQEMLLLRSRLTVMERSELKGLDSHLALELERFRSKTATDFHGLLAG